MNAADYDAWYDTPRGRWVGDAECRMLLRAVEPRQGESLLDVGCGTGWFTRRMARLPGVQVTGLDINADWLAYARECDAASNYIEGDALALPFADSCFDGVVSIAALCFTSRLAPCGRRGRSRQPWPFRHRHAQPAQSPVA